LSKNCFIGATGPFEKVCGVLMPPVGGIVQFGRRARAGGAVAQQGYGYYYGAPAYYAPGYYGAPYDNGPAMIPAPAADAIAWCMQNYSSYDPQAGTYIGDDGSPHPCP
jgi:hypothetical protein